jgi:hypothetical protein
VGCSSTARAILRQPFEGERALLGEKVKPLWKNFVLIRYGYKKRPAGDGSEEET